jgi:hypothetical protein
MSKKQEIFFNNSIKPNISKENINYIWDNINTSDVHLLKHLNNIVSNPYQLKLNLIINLLNSNQSIPISNISELEKFFKMLSPLNIEYNLGSTQYNKQIISGKLFLQNSISKKESSDIFYNKYINQVKNVLSLSNIDFEYFEFKSKRFNKTKDIIWVFDLEQFNNK